MKKNYYDILQVNKNASPEIIEKAYKTLAKKYHPDLQPAENKNNAEEILKEINEAYEVLKDPEKKKIYDASLSNEKNSTSSKIKQNESPRPTYNTNVSNQEAILKKQQIEQEELRRQELFYKQQLQQARKKAYHDAYIQDLKNRGYKIRYKKSFKDYLKCFIAMIITLFFLFLVFQIPFVKNYFHDLYLENPIIKLLVDCVLNLFN